MERLLSSPGVRGEKEPDRRGANELFAYRLDS